MAVIPVAGGAQRLGRPFDAVPERARLSLEVRHAELIEQSGADDEREQTHRERDEPSRGAVHAKIVVVRCPFFVVREGRGRTTKNGEQRTENKERLRCCVQFVHVISRSHARSGASSARADTPSTSRAAATSICCSRKNGVRASRAIQRKPWRRDAGFSIAGTRSRCSRRFARWLPLTLPS